VFPDSPAKSRFIRGKSPFPACNPFRFPAPIPTRGEPLVTLPESRESSGVASHPNIAFAQPAPKGAGFLCAGRAY
jgi:hypothetical protein